MIEQLAQEKIKENQKENERLAAEREALMQAVDGLLKVVKHERSSCSDEDMYNAGFEKNGYSRCVRCDLLAMKLDGVNPGWVLDSICLRGVPDECTSEKVIISQLKSVLDS